MVHDVLDRAILVKPGRVAAAIHGVKQGAKRGSALRVVIAVQMGDGDAKPGIGESQEGPDGGGNVRIEFGEQIEGVMSRGSGKGRDIFPVPIPEAARNEKLVA